MTAALAPVCDSSTDSPEAGYRASCLLVLDPETGEHRMFPTKQEAQRVADRWPSHLRLLPFAGKYDADKLFMGLMCNLLA